MTTHEEQNRETVRALAERVLADRLSRYVVVGVTEKGRIISEPRGEPTEAERQWVALQAEARLARAASCA